MGIGQSSALLILGAVLRWLALPTRHLSIRGIGLVTSTSPRSAWS